MLRIDGNFCLGELINYREADLISFIDKEEKTIVTYDNTEVRDKKDLLKLPYVEELVCENEILKDYIRDRGLLIPWGTPSKEYIRENDYDYDFFDLKRERLIKAFSEWLIVQQVEIDFTA